MAIAVVPPLQTASAATATVKSPEVILTASALATDSTIRSPVFVTVSSPEPASMATAVASAVAVDTAAATPLRVRDTVTAGATATEVAEILPSLVMVSLPLAASVEISVFNRTSSTLSTIPVAVVF